MHIVHVAPDFIPVPPVQYGGIERVVFEIVQEMVQRGNDVYLYALPGSVTDARLIPYEHERDPWKIVGCVKATLPQRVDVIHDHTHGAVIGRRSSAFDVPVICSIHIPWYKEQVDNPVFPSRMMQNSIGLGSGYMVHYGTNIDDYPMSEHKSDYLLFLGRLNEEKGIVHAITVAEQTKRRLIIAGPSLDIVDPEKHQYYLKEIQPRLNSNTDIVYLGEVSHASKVRLLQHAGCLLFPSDVEAFGLVLVEAMACGTPVLALAKGAVPEVLNGFPELICDSVQTMIEKVNHWTFPSPNSLRTYVERHFSSKSMVDNYLTVYKRVLFGRKLLSWIL